MLTTKPMVGISQFRTACGDAPFEMTRRVNSSSPKRVMPSEAEASQSCLGLPQVKRFTSSPTLGLSDCTKQAISLKKGN